MWADFREVWVQPLYVPITGWEDGRPVDARAARGAWVFSVGPDSGFYSPFWQIVYFKVPEGTPTDRLRSERRTCWTPADVRCFPPDDGAHDGSPTRRGT